MSIKIKTKDYEMAEGLKKSAPASVSVDVWHLMTRSAVDPGWVVATLEFIRDKSVELDLALISAWLYDKSKKDKSCQIHNGRKKIIKTKAGIRRGIEENLQIGMND